MSSPRTLLRTGALIAFLAFSGWITERAKRLDLGRGNEGSTLIGKSAPDFTLRSAEGQEVRLSDYRGKKAVILAFWASWCGPCRMEMPSLESFYKKNRQKNVVLLAVSIDQNPEAAREYAREHNLPFPVLIDQDSKTAESYDVEGIPSVFVVDPQGQVRFFHAGADFSLEAMLSYEITNTVQKGNRPGAAIIR
jgi:peroxiredoxin